MFLDRHQEVEYRRSFTTNNYPCTTSPRGDAVDPQGFTDQVELGDTPGDDATELYLSTSWEAASQPTLVPDGVACGKR